MTEYLSSVDQELLYAIRAIEVLLESGVGIAEAMKHIADEEYGDLSGVFKQIFKDTDGGKAFGDAIRTQSRKTDSAGLRRVLSALVMSVEEDTNVTHRKKPRREKHHSTRSPESTQGARPGTQGLPMGPCRPHAASVRIHPTGTKSDWGRSRS